MKRRNILKNIGIIAGFLPMIGYSEILTNVEKNPRSEWYFECRKLITRLREVYPSRVIVGYYYEYNTNVKTFEPIKEYGVNLVFVDGVCFGSWLEAPDVKRYIERLFLELCYCIDHNDKWDELQSTYNEYVKNNPPLRVL